MWVALMIVVVVIVTVLVVAVGVWGVLTMGLLISDAMKEWRERDYVREEDEGY